MRRRPRRLPPQAARNTRRPTAGTFASRRRPDAGEDAGAPSLWRTQSFQTSSFSSRATTSGLAAAMFSSSHGSASTSYSSFSSRKPSTSL